jgi:hypothetical protein
MDLETKVLMEKIIMKKLLLFAALCAITLNAFSMHQELILVQNKPSASALILAGMGCVGVSMWYASKKDTSHQFKFADTVTITGGVIHSGGIDLSPRTIGVIAPLIPAMFCFWYGFKNLNS